MNGFVLRRNGVFFMRYENGKRIWGRTGFVFTDVAAALAEADKHSVRPELVEVELEEAGSDV